MFSQFFLILGVRAQPPPGPPCAASLPQICRPPLVPCGRARQCRVFCHETAVDPWRLGSGLLFCASFPEMSSPVLLLLLSLWTFAANYEAGSEMHIESSHPTQFSRGEASPGPDWWESPMGAEGCRALGRRGLGAGHLELPARSVIPVAYFLCSSKARFDTVWVFYFKGR